MYLHDNNRIKSYVSYVRALKKKKNSFFFVDAILRFCYFVYTNSATTFSLFYSSKTRARGRAYRAALLCARFIVWKRIEREKVGLSTSHAGGVPYAFVFVVRVLKIVFEWKLTQDFFFLQSDKNQQTKKSIFCTCCVFQPYSTTKRIYLARDSNAKCGHSPSFVYITPLHYIPPPSKYKRRICFSKKKRVAGYRPSLSLTASLLL